MTVGIIAEYNPFHNGHLHQLQCAKKIAPGEPIVVAMSGNWLQRGEPAAWDKWQRATQAVAAGVNLVVELPVAYAVQPADLFGLGGVKMLHAVGCDRIVCGAEHPDLDFIKLAQQTLDIKLDLSASTEAYALAYARAVTAVTGEVVMSPNDILALSYARAIVKLNLTDCMQLTPIKRIKADYNAQTLTPDATIASASAIRRALVNKTDAAVQPYVPATTWESIKDEPPVTWADFFKLLQHTIISTPPQRVAAVYGMQAGLEYRFWEQLQRNLTAQLDFERYVKLVKSKRYTYTKIARQATWLLLNATQAEVTASQQAMVAHILAFDEVGQQHLRTLKKTCPLPLISKVNHDVATKQMPLDYRAGLVYSLVTHTLQDLTRPPVRLKKN